MKNIFFLLACLTFLVGGWCFFDWLTLRNRQGLAAAPTLDLIAILLSWILGALWLILHRLWPYPEDKQ